MTTQDNTAGLFEYWRDMFQKSTEAWPQAANATGNPFWPPVFGSAPSGPMPGFGQMPGFNSAPGFNPFAQFMLPFSGDLQQVWQQFYNSWPEQAK